MSSSGAGCNVAQQLLRCGLDRVTQPGKYLRGRREAVETRLKRRIANLAPDSDAQFDRIGNVRNGVKAAW